MFSAVRIEVENLDLHTYTQRGTQFYACAQRWFLLARRLTSWFCLPVWHSRRFLNKKRTREAPYWRVELRSSAPGGSGPNGNRITLVFPFTFMDSMKDGLGPEARGPSPSFMESMKREGKNQSNTVSIRSATTGGGATESGSPIRGLSRPFLI